MTDEERAAFPNLILLCSAHHKLVDRIRRQDYPVEMLEAPAAAATEPPKQGAAPRVVAVAGVEWALDAVPGLEGPVRTELLACPTDLRQPALICPPRPRPAASENELDARAEKIGRRIDLIDRRHEHVPLNAAISAQHAAGAYAYRSGGPQALTHSAQRSSAVAGSTSWPGVECVYPLCGGSYMVTPHARQ